MDVSYEYYRMFYYVARYRNLTQAAEVLHNSQPNVTRTMKLLEHSLGCKLLIRSNRGIALTPEGEELYQHVKAAVEQIQAAEEKLHRLTRLQDGLVSVGSSDVALHLLLLPVLHEFKETYPQVQIRISNNVTRRTLDAVRSGLVDFAMVTTPMELKAPLAAHLVFAYHDILVGGPAYRWLAEKKVSLKELAEYPMVSLGEDTVTHDFFSEFYQHHHLVWRPELEATTTDQILPLVCNNLGLGFVPEVLAEEAVQKGMVFPIPLAETVPPRQIYLVENESHPMGIAARRLADMLCAFCEKITIF